MYGMTMADDQGYIPLPQVAVDNPQLNQGGFRTDWTPTLCDTVTIQGDFYVGKDNASGVITPPMPQNTLNCSRTMFLTRWVHEIDDDTDWAIQAYYYNPHASGTNLNTVSTFDLDFQHHKRRGRHDFVWGFGYRNSYEHWRAGAFAIEKLDSEQVPSYFLQDTITLINERLYLTLGSKFDHNSVTRFEYQPTVRVAWTPDERTSIWGAVSRAARIPSLYERLYVTPRGEHALSYEAGIRRQPTDKLYWELATFFNRYDNLLGGPYYFFYQNIGSADTYGFEFNATYEVNERWRLSGNYSFLVEDVDFPPDSIPQTPPGTAPRNMAYFQSSWNLGNNVSLDMMFRYMDSLPVGVAAYFAGDIRLAWRPASNLELSLVGQNLYAGNHDEFYNYGGALPTEVEPGVYGMVSWRY
jgi:iron complex outermembrane receptor protein